ncbi:MAG: DNA repair protein RadC [Chloroflexi bacterium]|nr:DNA repair protein RadC [Chloroflexota bacterium]
MTTTVDRAPVEYLPRIRELPAEERPRERLIKYGSGALSNAELIAILLRTGLEGENAVGVAQRLLTRFSGLRGLATASHAELCAERGLSDAKYCQLMAALELGRRMATLSRGERPVIREPGDVVTLLAPEMTLLDQEQMRVVLLTTKHQVLSAQSVYVGTVNSSLVRAAEVFRPAVRANAPAIIVVHNHPSGDATPSQEDIALTQHLRQAGQTLNVDLLDHVVIGHDQFVSMKQRRLGFE